jgi:hypothetical protein
MVARIFITSFNIYIYNFPCATGFCSSLNIWRCYENFHSCWEWGFSQLYALYRMYRLSIIRIMYTVREYVAWLALWRFFYSYYLISFSNSEILKPAVFKSLKFDAICLNVIFKGNLLKLILMLRYSQQSKCKGSCGSKSPYTVVSTIEVTLVCNSAEVLFPLQPAFIFGFCTSLITVACRPVAREQLRKKQLYSSCCWVTALQTSMFAWQQKNSVFCVVHAETLAGQLVKVICELL